MLAGVAPRSLGSQAGAHKSMLAFILEVLVWISGALAIVAVVLVFVVKILAHRAYKKEIPVLQRDRDALQKQGKHDEADKKTEAIDGTYKRHANRVGWAEVISIVLVGLGVAAQTVDSLVEKAQMADERSKDTAHQQQLAKLVETITEMQRAITALTETVKGSDAKIAALDAKVNALEAKVDTLGKASKGGGSGKRKDDKDGDPGDDKPPGPKDSGGGNAASLPEAEKRAIDDRIKSLSLRVDRLERRPGFEVEVADRASGGEFDLRVKEALQRSLAELTEDELQQALSLRLALYSRGPAGSGA